MSGTQKRKPCERVEVVPMRAAFGDKGEVTYEQESCGHDAKNDGGKYW